GYQAVTETFLDLVAVRAFSSFKRLWRSTPNGPEAQAAIPGQNPSGHVSAVPTGPEDGDTGNVIGLAPAAPWGHLFDPVRGLVAHRLTHVRLDEPWGDGIDRHAAAGELNRQGPGEGIDRPFARRVVRLPRVGVLGRDAGHVDDPAAPLFHERVRHRP